MLSKTKTKIHYAIPQRKAMKDMAKRVLGLADSTTWQELLSIINDRFPPALDIKQSVTRLTNINKVNLSHLLDIFS